MNRVPLIATARCSLLHDVSDPAQTVLPTLRYSGGIERRDVKLDARGGQIDAHPVHQAAALLGCIQSLTTVGNSRKYLRRGLRPTPLPPNKTAADQRSHDHHHEHRNE